MYTYAGVVLAVLAVVFGVARYLRLSTELSLLCAALAGFIVHGITHGVGSPRYIVDGAFTYLDICLIFITATLFMNLFKESGGVTYVIRAIIKQFHDHRVLCLFFLTFVLLVPGALTGAGAVTCLVVGGLVGKVLTYMGVSKVRATAAVFVCAACSAAAPPINLWAMMAAAGANMPYVGYSQPLGLITVLGALFTMFYLGWKGHPPELEQIMEELPEPPEGMNIWKVLAPFVVFFGLLLATRVWPFTLPTFGLPLIFIASAFTTFILSPKWLPLISITRKSLKDLLPLVGVMIVVGILVEVMALTGARGLLSLGVVLMPLTALFALLWLIIPFAEGLIQYAAAPLLGIPLLFLFNMEGMNAVIALSGIATMLPIGDMLPPTTVVGRTAVMVTEYEGPYYRGFLVQTLVPAAFVLGLGTMYLVFSNELSFLVGGI